MNLTEQEAAVYSKYVGKIVQNVETVIIGKTATVELVVLAMLSGGHVLIEDVPGVGKTSLVSCLLYTSIIGMLG